MNRCWSCGVELGVHNLTHEHIVPNSIGGHRISTTILCDPCNKGFSPLDAELAKFAAMCMVLLNPKKDYGKKAQALATEVGTNIETILYAGGEGRLRNPIVQTENGITEIQAPTEKRLEQEIQRLKKISPKIDFDQSFQNKEFRVHEVSGDFKSSMIGRRRELYRACAKIGLNQLFDITPYSQGYKESIEFVKTGVGEDLVFNFEYEGEQNINIRPFHFVNLVGKVEEKIAYAYIGLFESIRFLIILDRNFEGQNFNRTLIHFLDGNFAEGEINKTYTRSEIEFIFENKPRITSTRGE